MMSSYNGNMIQCLLGKEGRFQVAWIPEGKALVGNIIELIGTDYRERGWRVVSAGNKLPAVHVRERSRDYVNTRKASDI